MRALVVKLALLGLLVTGCAGGLRHGAAGGDAAPTGDPAQSQAAISARLVLHSRTLTAGSSVSGHVVIENNTGHVIRTGGCYQLFQVLLVSRSYHPEPAWLQCLQFFTIPTGRSSYRVTVAASFNQCGESRSAGGLKACLPGGGMPPLPAGTYRAVLFQVRHLVPAPRATSIRVIAQGSAGP
jgi:hypothetical protein